MTAWDHYCALILHPTRRRVRGGWLPTKPVVPSLLSILTPAFVLFAFALGWLLAVAAHGS